MISAKFLASPALVFADLKGVGQLRNLAAFTPQKSDETAVALVGMNYTLQI